MKWSDFGFSLKLFLFISQFRRLFRFVVSLHLLSARCVLRGVLNACDLTVIFRVQIWIFHGRRLYWRAHSNRFSNSKPLINVFYIPWPSYVFINRFVQQSFPTNYRNYSYVGYFEKIFSFCCQVKLVRYMPLLVFLPYKFLISF